jgi:hypothetical protein
MGNLRKGQGTGDHLSVVTRHLSVITGVIVLLLIASACQDKNNSSSKSQKSKEIKVDVNVPVFSADTAYSLIEKQLAFGPRVPNTAPHEACAKWMQEKLTEYGAEVIVQNVQLEAFDGTKLNSFNIIAQFQAEKANRLLLMAHWDSRPYADHDPDPDKKDSPIMGANDGASGVGVLMEIARKLGQEPSALGIDIVLFDSEDYGVPDHKDIEWSADSWCLGSQYWAANPHKKNYYARYGILLDMVGAKDAIFTQEEISVFYARSVVDQVWKAARNLGHSSYFSFEKTPQIVDDHRYVNEILGIPSIDIIQYDFSTESNFGSYWHTHDDNLSVIDKNTLKAVGETVMMVIYSEN